MYSTKTNVFIINKGFRLQCQMFRFFWQICIIFTRLWMLTFFSVWRSISIFSLCISLPNLACFSQSREAFTHFPYASRCQIQHVSLSLKKHFHISRVHLVAKFDMLYVASNNYALSFLTCATGIIYICTVYIHLHGFLKVCTFLVSSLYAASFGIFTLLYVCLIEVSELMFFLIFTILSMCFSTLHLFSVSLHLLNFIWLYNFYSHS